MESQRAKLANESIRTSSGNESKGISDTTDRVDAIMESTYVVTRRSKKISDGRSTNSDLLSTDLVMEIFKRVPAKTLARFLCVSKPWESIIRRRYFKKLFFNESSNRPSRLFISFMRDKHCFLFSSLETPNPGEAALATYHMTYPAFENAAHCSSVHGLICYGTSMSELVVYNHSTRKSIALPKLDLESFVMKPYLGYDPINGIYKVLCLTGRIYQVLTLGNGNEWRRVIEIENIHFPVGSQICINGVLYYGVNGKSKTSVIMSFDVRSEKLDLIKGPVGDDFSLSCFSTMIRYEGKLATTSTRIFADGSMVLWVLEDAVEHKWLKKVFVLPKTSLTLGVRTTLSHKLRFIHVTDDGELIVAPFFLNVSPYYVLYYDPEKNSVRKVEIEGIAEHKLLGYKKGILCALFNLFSSQVENLMFL